MKILAIESSCDETGISILEIKNNQYTVLANFLYSQVQIFKKYGGVIPEVAAREHTERILPLFIQTLKKSKLKPEQIDLVAVTNSPGLVTSLIVGVELAKAFSYVYKKPLIPINHHEAHLVANWFGKLPKGKLINIPLPSLGLLISGGHTSLIKINKLGSYKIIGQTLDDAAGESFDKVAQLLNLGYPGGPIVSQKAKKGNKQAFDFPRPMLKSGDFNFSFSGLKTAVRQTFEKILNSDKKPEHQNDQVILDICASFQEAVSDTLIRKTLKAAAKHKVKSILLAGGVASNTYIQEEFKKNVTELGLPIFIPEHSLCTDNSLMIALCAYLKFKNIKDKKPTLNKAEDALLNTWKKIDVSPIGKL